MFTGLHFSLLSDHAFALVAWRLSTKNGMFPCSTGLLRWWRQKLPPKKRHFFSKNKELNQKVPERSESVWILILSSDYDKLSCTFNFIFCWVLRTRLDSRWWKGLQVNLIVFSLRKISTCPGIRNRNIMTSHGWLVGWSFLTSLPRSILVKFWWTSPCSST